jgi:hypothetical protein
MKKTNDISEFDEDQLRRNIRLSPKEKLERLEKLNDFLRKITPAKNKEVWEKLKKQGW